MKKLPPPVLMGMTAFFQRNGKKKCKKGCQVLDKELHGHKID
jgi:hypothetical protein